MITVQKQGTDENRMPWVARAVGVVWGIGGVAAVLVYAAISLGRYAQEAVAAGLGPTEWLVLVVNAAVMAWAEGYRGFQRRFSPRVAARALNLFLHPTVLRLMLAPLFCAGYFGATVRLGRAIWIGTGCILLAVLLFSQLPQPWRGILDAGVLVGMVWGTITLLVMGWTTFREHREIVPAEVPAEVPPPVTAGIARGAGL
jgi:hypothetical protein